MARARAKYEITAEDRTKRAFESVNGRLGKMSSGFKTLGAGLAGLVGIGGFGALIKGAIDAGDEINKLNIQLGASTEFLSEMRHVAELSGVGFTTFTNSIRTMQRSLIDATRGSKTQGDAFESLGLDVEALAKMKPAEQFQRIGEALRGLTNDTLRSSIAAVIFGARNSEVLRITQQGSDAIRSMREEAVALGTSLSTEQAAQLAAANDAMTRFKASIQGLGTALAVNFAEPLANVVDYLREFGIPAIKNFAAAVEDIARALGGDFGFANFQKQFAFEGVLQRAREAGMRFNTPQAPSGGDRLEGAFIAAPKGGPAEVRDPQVAATNEILERISRQLTRGQVGVAG